MEFKRLLMQRFLAVGNKPVEVIFNGEGGINHIRGLNHDVMGRNGGPTSNGSGKSNFVEGVLFGLYGRTLRSLNQGDIVNTHCEGECRVELEFDNVRINRTLNPTSCEFYIDGVDQSMATIPETNKKIKNFLDVSFETMCNILIFGQHNMISFLDAKEGEKREIIENLLNLKEYHIYEEKARKLVRETQTGLKVSTEKHEILSKHLLEQQKLLAEQNELLNEFREKIKEEIEDINDRLSKVPDIDQLRKDWEKYNSYIKKRDQLDKQKTDCLMDLDVVNKEIAAFEKGKNDELNGKQNLLDSLSQINTKIHQLSQRKNDLIAGLQEKTDKASAIDNDIVSLDVEQNQGIRDIPTTINEINASYNVAIAEIKRINTKIENIANKELTANETCPTCFGTIDPNNAAKAIQHLDEEKKKYTKQANDFKTKSAAENDRVSLEVDKVKSSYQSKKLELQKSKAIIQSEVEASRKQIQEQYDTTYNKLSKKKLEIESEISEFNNSIEEKYKVLLDPKNTQKDGLLATQGNITKEMRSLGVVVKPAIEMEDIGRIKEAKEADEKLLKKKQTEFASNPYGNIINSLTENIEESESNLEKAKDDITDKEKMLPYLSFWSEAFGKEGIKSFIIDQIIPTLNEQIEYWMQLVYHGAITVKFDKLLNVSMVNNASKHEMIFGQGSGGERKRIDIAIMLAFRQIMKMSTGRNPNIVFLDECMENIDEDGVYKFYDAIVDMSKTDQVFVITHNLALQNCLQGANIINVEKKDGVMYLVKNT